MRGQRYCRALAASLAGEGGDPEGVHPGRHRVLDGLFLRFVRDRPERCPEIYARMFAGVPPGPLVRFLTEKSSPLDEARLVGALPKLPFLRTVGEELIDRAPRRG